MGFDKTVESRIWGVTLQGTNLRTPTGDSSGGTFTALRNPLRGSLIWDDCSYILHGVAVAGGATGASFNLTIETDAINGATALPIARSVNVGPNSAGTIVLDSLHQSPGSPLPTHLNIQRTAGTDTVSLQCHVFAKQYRGTLGTPGNKTSERILQGVMLRGTSALGTFADDRGMTEDETFTLGTSGSNLGMHRIRMWDRAFYWAKVDGTSIAGTHDVDIVGTIGGTTFSIATTGTAGTLNAAGEVLAIANNMYGVSPNPSAIIWTETTAGGVSNAVIVGCAKTGRGTMGKR